MRAWKGWGLAVLLVGLGLLAWARLRSARAPGDTTGAASRHEDGASRKGPRAPGRSATLPRGSLRLTGVVRGPRGPVAGVRVEASRVEPEVTLSERACPPSEAEPDAPTDSLLDCGGRGFDELVAAVDAHEGEAPVLAEATTGADGAFVLEGLPEGRVSLWARGEDGAGRRDDVATDARDVVLPLDDGLTFEGDVVTAVVPKRAPLKDARVIVFSREHTRFFDTTTDAAGHFRVGPLPRAAYAVLVLAQGYAPLLRTHADPLRDDLIILERPARFAGRVVTAQGQPAPGVPVRLKGSGVAEWRDTLTDARGHFSLASIEDVPGALFAETLAHDGFAWLETAPGEDLVLTLEPGMFFEGTVRDERGRPVPGARVRAARLQDYGGTSPGVEATTDAKGHYRVGPLFSFDHTLSARAPRYLMTAPERFVAPDDTGPFDLTLKRAVSVEGVLVDEAGQPVADALVELHPGSLSDDIGEDAVASELTDEAGRFLLDTEHEGPGWLAVADADFVPQRLEVRIPSREVRMVLSRGSTLSVTVLNATGAGARDVKVTLWKRDARGQSAGAGTTDAHGRLPLRGVPAGRYVVEALVPGRAVDVRVTQPLDVAEGESQDVTLRLEEGRALSGVVVNTRGEPLAGVAVRARVPDVDMPRYRDDASDAPVRPDGVLTDVQGRFTLRPLSAPRHELTVSLDGYALARPRCQGVAFAGSAPWVERDTSEVRLVLRRIPRVRGRLVVEGGGAPEAFTVNGTVFRDPGLNGHFSLPLPDEGPRTLEVVARGLAPLLIDVTPDGEADVDLGTLTLTRGRTLRVNLRSQETGRPYGARLLSGDGSEVLLGVQPWVLAQNAPEGVRPLRLARSVPDENGTVLLEKVPTAAFTLLLDAPGCLTVRRAVSATDESLTLALTRGAHVTGTVRDAQGRPVDARLSLISLSVPDHVAAQYVREGSFTLQQLPSGDYALEVEAESVDGKRPRFAPRMVHIPESGDMTLTLQATGPGTGVALHLPEDVDEVMLLAGALPAPATARDLRRLGFLATPPVETGATVRYVAVPAGLYTVFATTRGEGQLHREALDVPAGGALSRELHPVWTPLAP